METICHLSGVQSITKTEMLGLGCGAGILVKYLLKRKEDIEFTAVDVDPCLLAIFQNTLALMSKVAISQEHIRNGSWFRQYQNSFDAVISLTSVHGLSQKNQKILYRRINSVLKDGGIFLNGDSYLSTDTKVRIRLAEL